MLTKVLVAFGCAAIAFSGGLLSGNRQSGRFTLVEGPVPLLPLDSLASAVMPGQVTARLDVVRGRVVGVHLVTATPAVLWPVVQSFIREWRFSSNQSGSLEATVQYSQPTAVPSCDLRNAIVTFQPSRVEIVMPSIPNCEMPVELMPEISLGPSLQGLLRCDCPSKRFIPGAMIHLTPAEPTRQSRTVRSDADGQFRADSLSPGRYSMTVQAEGYATREYSIVVSDSGASARQIEFTLKEDIRTVVPPSTLITAATIPTYPDAARVAGISGDVSLRVSTHRNNIININADSGHELLVRAAVDNVRTWRLSRTTGPVFKVNFKYVLLDSRACEVASPSQASMRFPADIEVMTCVGAPIAR